MLLRRLMLLAVGSFLAVDCFPQPENDPATLLGEADHLADLFNWADAGPLYARAAELFTGAGDQRNALYAKFGAIRGSMETLNLPETADYLGNQLQTALVEKDQRLKLMCLIVKGDIDGEIDSAPARADWEEALAVATRLGDSKWKSRAAAELGFEQFLQGEIGRARKAVASALITAHETGDVGAEIRYLAAIGTALAWNRLDDQAISYLDRSIDLAKKHPDSGFPFFAVAGKIQALVNKKDYKQASQLIDESAREAASRKKEIKLAEVLLFKADIAFATGRAPEGLSILNQTAELTRGGHSRLFADAEIRLADGYREQKDFQRAEEAAQTAVAATGGSRDMYYAPARLGTLAELEQAQGHLEQASELYQRATDIVEGLIAASPDQEARASLMAEMSPIFVDHFAIAAHRGDVDDAFRIIEQVRGRIVTERLLQPSFDQSRNTQTEDAIRRLKVQLVQAQTTRRRRELVDRLFFAEQARWTEASQDNGHPLDISAEITLSDVQRRLHGNEVVLEYVLGDTDSFCLQITRSNARIIKLVPRAAIESYVRSYSAAIKAQKDASRESRRLFECLIQPVHLSATWKSIIIVPDGVLHTVPFSALEESAGSFLISNHAVSFAPSAGTLALLRARQHSTPPKMFLGVGGVEYSNKSESVLLADAKTPLTRGDYYGVDFSQIPDLPGTGEEIRSAADIVGAEDAKLLTGRSGTETEFKSARLNQFRIIHLAVHGKANVKNPDSAALIFRPDPPDDDGLLEPREILGLHLNADLVVLSACNTAVGHLQGEERHMLLHSCVYV